jgi:solute:Na+ symporter, SSS family
VKKFTPNQLLNTRYFWDGLFPFAVLILTSLVTRDRNRERADFFFGKMKTPVGETPELDAVALEETRRNPHRFDDNKLLGPQSSWEFGKWNREDGLGFIACVAVSAAIILIFVGLLKLASPA